MTIVVDASVIVSALTDGGEVGVWADSLLVSGALVAPHLMPVEAANALRRAAMAGDISGDVASLAHRGLLLFQVTLLPYAPYATRIWELRSNLTAYDAWYVALAESLGAPLATLDVRLRRAPGPRCEFALPPE